MSQPSETEFDDHGRRLLPDMVYDPVLDEHGHRTAFRIPEHEKPIWEALERQRQNRGGVYAHSAPAGRQPQEAKPIQQLVVELEEWMEMGGPLESDLRDAYESDPTRVTRIAQAVIDGCMAKRVTSPGGLLFTRLKEIVRIR